MNRHPIKFPSGIEVVESVKGFLVTRQWDDVSIPNNQDSNSIPAHVQGRKPTQLPKLLELCFWITTDDGPAKLTFNQQESVFFVLVEDFPSAKVILDSIFGSMDRNLWRTKPLELNTFSHGQVQAVYFSEQRNLYRAREVLKNHGVVPLEADIQPTDRFLMERFITGPVHVEGDAVVREGFREFINPKIKKSIYAPSYKVLSLDIETSLTGDHLYSIGLATNCTDERDGCFYQRVFILTENSIDNAPEYLVACHSERELMIAFMQWLEVFDPDIIIGWNVINFDLRFLQRKADELQLRLNLGRNRGPIDWRSSRGDNEHYTLLVPGRLVLDGIDTLRSATYNFESFSLQYVSHELLKRGKLIHDADDRGEEITRLFNEDKLALAAYNLEDCQLVWDIFQVTELIDFAVERASLTGLAMDRFGGSVASFDNRYLPRLHRAGYVAPNLPEDPQGVGSPGGYVMDSQPGIYDHVLVLDFKSLYPSIIRTFKIDPMALAIGVDLTGQEPVRDRLETKITEHDNMVPGFNGAAFSKHQNLLPDIIGELWAARDEAKRKNNAAMSQAIKILMNSFYGVLGTPGCRFFDYRLPSSITLRGHAVLTQTKRLIEEKGYQVIYGDTDSVFVWLKEENKHISTSDVNSVGKELSSTLNQWWQNYLADTYKIKSFLEIEFETHFSRFVMPTIRGSDKGSKKRYAGLVTKGDGGTDLVFKGLETVRTDWTPLARAFQYELYRRIFYDEPYQEYIQQVVNDLKGGQLDDQLYYRKRIRRRLDDYQKNVPPHVQAARLADQKRLSEGKESRYHRGGWIQYVLTLNGPEPVEYQTSKLDYDLYVERQIEPIVDGILHFLGVSFSDITDDQLGLF